MIIVKVSADVLRKKEKECRKLQQEIQQEKEKFGNLTMRHQQDMIALQAVCWTLISRNLIMIPKR